MDKRIIAIPQKSPDNAYRVKRGAYTPKVSRHSWVTFAELRIIIPGYEFIRDKIGFYAGRREATVQEDDRVVS